MANWRHVFVLTVVLPYCHGLPFCPTTMVTINVVFLSRDDSRDLGFEKAFHSYLASNNSFPACVKLTVTSADIDANLQLPEKGWTNIHAELKRLGPSDVLETHIVVGPYFMNVAMMLEQLDVAYLTTAGKGYGWSDMNRVEDPVDWATTVSLIPAQQDQNRAVLDLFLVRHWRNVIMIMPDRQDHEECTDLAHQMEMVVSLIPFSIPTNSSDTRDFIKTVLRNAQLMSQRQIIICSPRDNTDNLIYGVLEQANKYKMLESEDWSFVISDPYSLLRALSGLNNNVNLGLFKAKCELLSFLYIPPKREIMDPHYALAADTALILGKAMHGYFKEAGTLASNDDFSSLKLLQQIKQLSGVNGETGHLQFNDRGERTNYKLGLYKYGGAKVFRKIGEWRKPETKMSKTGIVFTKDDDDDDMTREDMGIFPPIVKVAVVVDAPFVMMKKGRKYKKPKFEGFSIDLLKQLSKDLLFSYEVYQAPNNSYGTQADDGTWDGAVGEVVSKKAMLALGALSITSSRETAIDFTHGIMTTGSTILIPKPRETLSIFQFLKPFSPTLWYALLTAFFVLCGMFYLLDYHRKNRVFTPKECLWFCLGILLMRGTDFSPKSTPQRILTTGYIFFALITVSTYTANMAAFLTTANLNPEVESFGDLVTADDLTPLTISHTSTMSYLNNSNDRVVQALWQRIVSTEGIVATAEEGIRRVADGGHALIFDDRVNEYAEQTECTTMAVGVPVLRLEHGIGLPAGSSCKSLLDMAILKLRESGYINMLVNKWWTERRRCERTNERKKSREAQFRSDHMAGIFIVGGSGMCLSVFFFVVKKLYLRRQEGVPEQDGPAAGVTDTSKLDRQATVFGFQEADQVTKAEDN